MLAVTIPEVLLNTDFLKCYLCKIKSVSLAAPTSFVLYAFLDSAQRFLSHKRWEDSQSHAACDYLRSTEDIDPGVSAINGSINAITVSSEQNQGSVFRSGCKGERHLPFGGAGVINMWCFGLLQKPSSWTTWI